MNTILTPEKAQELANQILDRYDDGNPDTLASDQAVKHQDFATDLLRAASFGKVIVDINRLWDALGFDKPIR